MRDLITLVERAATPSPLDSSDSEHLSENFSFLRELAQLDEARAKPFFDPAATYLHGGPPVLDGGALKRYGKNGGDMGGLFFTKNSPEGRAYAVSYTFGKNGVVYKVKIDLPVDAVFDLQNAKHRHKLQAAVSPEEWSYLVDSQRGGQLDWAVVDEDQLGEAGFKGAILAERPPGVVSENFVYSVAVFDAAVVRIIGQMSPEEVQAVAASIARYDAR
jgi:hypothetical protein